MKMEGRGAKMYKRNLKLVIKYLKGEIDIYNGQYQEVIQTWNQAWDEMKWMGYNPESADSIANYIALELQCIIVIKGRF